jgi:hypothetical protein
MQLTRLIAGALLTLALFPALAQVQSAKGMATVSYAGRLTPEVKEHAYHDAQVNAVERYVADSGAAQTENFELIRSKVSAAIGNYVLGATIVSEETRADAHQYSVAVRADINAARLSIELKNSSTVANTADQEKSPLMFVFVARAQDSVKSFDAHVYKRTDKNGSMEGTANDSKTGTEGEQVTPTQVSTNASTSSHVSKQTSTTDTSESGGSVTHRADQFTWQLIPSGYISSIVTGAFSSAGFQVVDAEYVEPESKGLLSIRALQSDYTTGNDLQPQTMRNTVEGLRAAQIRYLALATLDVGLPGIDPQTGLTKVYVTVTGKILDVSGRFPRTVATVGPEQFAGTGPSADVAQTGGVRLAADKAAHELVSQINVVGVH